MPALVTAQSGDWGYIIEIETKIWRLNDLRMDGPTDEVNYRNSFPVKKVLILIPCRTCLDLEQGADRGLLVAAFYIHHSLIIVLLGGGTFAFIEID